MSRPWDWTPSLNAATRPDPRGPHVAPDQDAVDGFPGGVGRLEDEPREPGADGMGEVVVELVGDRAADVVRLEDVVQHRHDGPP